MSTASDEMVKFKASTKLMSLGLQANYFLEFAQAGSIMEFGTCPKKNNYDDVSFEIVFVKSHIGLRRNREEWRVASSYVKHFMEHVICEKHFVVS